MVKVEGAGRTLKGGPAIIMPSDGNDEYVCMYIERKERERKYKAVATGLETRLHLSLLQFNAPPPFKQYHIIKV